MKVNVSFFRNFSSTESSGRERQNRRELMTLMTFFSYRCSIIIRGWTNFLNNNFLTQKWEIFCDNGWWKKFFMTLGINQASAIMCIAKIYSINEVIKLWKRRKNSPKFLDNTCDCIYDTFKWCRRKKVHSRHILWFISFDWILFIFSR